MLNYRPTGRSRLRRPLKRLLDEAETGLSRSNTWRMMMMMTTTMTTTILFSRRVSPWNGLVREVFSYCLRRGSVAARFLGLRILIPPGAWMPLSWSVVCCQVEVSVLGWSLDKRGPTDCDVSVCFRETSITRRPLSIGAVAPLPFVVDLSTAAVTECRCGCRLCMRMLPSCGER
jgi:hypothetical protein